PLAQIDERDRAPLILEHAFEKVRRLGQRRRCLVSQDALDLKDVEREILAADLESDQLDIITAGTGHGHTIRSPSASRSRIGTSRPRSVVKPRTAGSVRGISRTSVASPTSSTRPTGKPYDFPWERTSK